MTTRIIDEINGHESKICRTYRIMGGVARLFVGRDRRVWIGYGECPDSFSYIGDIPDGEPITKDAACRAANCW